MPSPQRGSRPSAALFLAAIGIVRSHRPAVPLPWIVLRFWFLGSFARWNLEAVGFGDNAQELQAGCPSFNLQVAAHIYVEVLQGYLSPWQLAHMRSVAHLGVRARCLCLHVEGGTHVGAQLGKVDRRSVTWSVRLARQALPNASDMRAEAWWCLMNQCTVSLRPCGNPSSLQALRGAEQAWLNDV